MQKTSHKQFIDQKYSREGWQTQLFEDCRFAAVEMYEMRLRDCEFIECKFSAINWRRGNFKHVVFRDCIFDKVDLAGSEFFSCSFNDCSWDEINLAGSKVGVKKLDLSGTKFGIVGGVEALRGHELDYEQAIALLPQLLAEFDIKIAKIDDEN